MVSQMVTDEVVWTDEGRAALAKEHTWGVPSFRASTVAALHAIVDEALARYRPCWKRGLAKCDGTGRALVEWALTWQPGQAATVEEAAGLASLLGARSGPYPDCALLELLRREHGAGFAVRVAVAAWSLCSDYDDPDYPKSETRLAIRLKAMDGGSSSANDTSVSHAKGHLAEYLGRVHREGSDDDRAQLTAGATAEYDAAPRHARPALAVAAQSRELAERFAAELREHGMPWYPHFASEHIPLLTTDPVVLEQFRFINDGRVTLRYLEQHGLALLPILERKCEGKQGPYARQQLTDVLVNVRGPIAARLLAAFAGKTPVAKQVRAYFERYPELAPADLVIAPKKAAKKPAAKKPAAKKPKRA